ncbi:MAG: NupC/NupG family nucleoside CNT transporter [Gammaproteobacteria bacterium]|jgi:CNT family concentrative nucleoside transporter|nr:NupC/NupG family nucleoside CNT transporter [Gammaproteobacteria bacterium]|tara:strand:+ start:504 stop:1712 length:1209 start_codon:yes stop_codon:yes gene_type:complete
MTSLLGIVLIPALAYLASSNRRRVNPRTVLGAFLIQASIGAFALYIPAGMRVLEVIASGVASILSYSQEGINFVFGKIGDQSIGFIFAFQVLPIIIFFSSLIAVLYHLRIMGWVVRLIGGGLQKALGTSRPESLSAAANIFVGSTEAPLAVRPFIPTMTRSELFAIMVGGLASIAGSVMAGYASMGIDLKYLLAASFMAAPGALMMAKIILPETEQPIDELDDVETAHQQYENVLDAAAAGASFGLQIALNVGAMLLAFISLIAMLNGLIGWAGGFIGFPDITFQIILGYLFQPVAWIMGVPWSEANAAGSLIGQKLVLNEFVAYVEFINIRESLSNHTQAVVTFALCGFANFASIAILMGGIGAMAPERRPEVAQLGIKAVFAASLANFMSASIAGLFLSL